MPGNDVLQPGDPVFHPRYGFGTICGITRRDPLHPVQDPAPAGAGPDPTEDYYDIQLFQGGTLLVPISRAVGVGLRRLTNGLEAIKACLVSPAQGLPGNYRERAAALRAREMTAEPTALAYSVRDMLAQSRGRTLSAGEKAWLDKSCERLSAEAALVDRISVAEARSAIWAAVHQLSAA